MKFNDFRHFSRTYEYNSDDRLNESSISDVRDAINNLENERDLSTIETAGITDFNGLFDDVQFKTNPKIGDWDVSDVKKMANLFSDSNFNYDISNWDVSGVEDMHNMFKNNKKFNQPIGDWTVYNVKTMKAMFMNAVLFNQPLAGWQDNDSFISAEKMEYMFSGAKAFNQPIGNWDVSNVTNMSYMFYHAASFNQDLNSWDVSNVFSFDSMFKGATSFNHSLGNWKVGQYIVQNPSCFNDFISGATSFITNMTDDDMPVYAKRDYDEYDNTYVDNNGKKRTKKVREKYYYYEHLPIKGYEEELRNLAK